MPRGGPLWEVIELKRLFMKQRDFRAWNKPHLLPLCNGNERAREEAVGGGLHWAWAPVSLSLLVA